jgi:hypothetical protein
LKGKGLIELDNQKRGAYNYRIDACLTMADFEKIILHCIIYYNSGRDTDVTSKDYGQIREDGDGVNKDAQLL